MQIYKIVEVKQKTLTKGTMTAAGLQSTINGWARFNWTLDRIVSGETAIILGAGAKEVLMVILKKTIVFPDDLFLMVDGQPSPYPITENAFMNMVNQNKLTRKTLSCRKGQQSWQPLEIIAPDIADAVDAFSNFS